MSKAKQTAGKTAHGKATSKAAKTHPLPRAEVAALMAEAAKSLPFANISATPNKYNSNPEGVQTPKVRLSFVALEEPKPVELLDAYAKIHGIKSRAAALEKIIYSEIGARVAVDWKPDTVGAAALYDYALGAGCFRARCHATGHIGGEGWRTFKSKAHGAHMDAREYVKTLIENAARKCGDSRLAAAWDATLKTTRASFFLLDDETITALDAIAKRRGLKSREQTLSVIVSEAVNKPITILVDECLDLVGLSLENPPVTGTISGEGWLKFRAMGLKLRKDADELMEYLVGTEFHKPKAA